MPGRDRVCPVSDGGDLAGGSKSPLAPGLARNEPPRAAVPPSMPWPMGNSRRTTRPPQMPTHGTDTRLRPRQPAPGGRGWARVGAGHGIHMTGSGRQRSREAIRGKSAGLRKRDSCMGWETCAVALDYQVSPRIWARVWVSSTTAQVSVIVARCRPFWVPLPGGRGGPPQGGGWDLGET